ncbi:peptide chain release factor N(5)-glutamine methyltransferase [Mycoplasma iguanae]|uniref:peptide chain release factor N(5)-glutamine methyltransferase n=1 Tax=Mycoplasma iguanae TaxID=292461 RepID=A0ABY5R8A0_9MOLU|nr:peptide chain release factor N(5)-glutamine methyltransferase [Mycoplasma iguanae]UVD81536.1 peptide chain release factor N(5)-glutamine methyltransferase [Mycoplasma iguanae]
MAISEEILLREKKRYNLVQTVSEQEKILLNQGMPVQKIIGYIEMQDVRIYLQYKVLIPRYETEEVILKALEYINVNSEVLDLCAGSGFIGLAIKKKTNAHLTLSDIDAEAIKQMQFNAKYNNLKVKIIQSDLFLNLPEKKYDVIVSNPPYIPQGMSLDKSIIDYEPLHALFAKNQGNYFYQKILQEAPKYLNKNGVIIFEIADWNVDFFKTIKGVEIFRDINQKQRIAVVKF